MKKFIRNALFLFLLLDVLVCKSAVSIAPVPSWIKPQPIFPNASIPASEINDGYYYVLVDEQINIVSQHYYSHYAYKIVSETGVQNSSELNFTYDPAYEKFVLHNLKVFRDGKYIIKTNSTPIKEMQRETELEAHIYNETISVVVVLSDIRPGDIIEYDYSTIGANPIFGGKFYYHFYFSHVYELLHASLRILKPASRSINVKLHNTDIKSDKAAINGLEEITWQANNIKGLHVDKSLPHSSLPYYSIELSEYNTWDEVNDWAKKVFSFQEPNNEILAKKITEIQEQFPDKETQLMAALRFVQTQIRYMGVEIGVNSHKPAPPNKVIEQHYGDCKDKTVLLCKILVGLGIKAYPAFVNSNDRAGVANKLISPRIFDHCIVKVELNEKDYWFDPTLASQEGNITSFYTPNYQMAFVVGGDKNALEEIPLNSFSKITVKEEYKIKDFSGNVTLKINSVYLGADADNIRNYFSNNGTKKISEDFLNFYKVYYPEVSILKTHETHDDKQKNLFTINEEYAISKFWKNPDSSNTKKMNADIYAYMIRDKIRAYNASHANRKMPLFLEYPIHIVQQIHIELPEDWNISVKNRDFTTEYIHFVYKIKQVRNIIDIDMEYKTLTNEIPADKAKDFVNLLDKINSDYMGIGLTYDASMVNASSAHSINWLLLIIFIMLLGIMSVLAIYQYRKHKKVIIDEYGIQKNPQTIGGWLVLPTIGLVFLPLLSLWVIFSSNYFDLEFWNKLTTPGSSVFHQLWAPALVLELSSYTFFLVFSLLLCFMLFSYDKRFPKYMVVLYAMKIFFMMVIAFIMYNIPTIDSATINENNTSLGRAVFSASIWIPYFLMSKRCKETFII